MKFYVVYRKRDDSIATVMTTNYEKAVKYAADRVNDTEEIWWVAEQTVNDDLTEFYTHL